MLFDSVFGERDTEPIVSGGTLSNRDVLVHVLEELASREHESFATFEVLGRSDAWFQVLGTGPDLDVGNCPWPLGLAPVEVTLKKCGIDIPAGFVVKHDDIHESRVISFECEPLSPQAWADFVHAYLLRIQKISAGYDVKGWVTRAD